MNKQQAIQKIYEFEQCAAIDFALTSNISAFVAASEKVKRNLIGFGITQEEYAFYSSQQQGAKRAPRGFFTDRPKLPNISDLDRLIEEQSREP